LSGQSNARYLYPAMPLLAVGIGGLFANLSGARLRAATAAATAAGLLNVWFLPASGWSHRDFFAGSAPPVRALVDQLNREHPGEPVVFTEMNQIAGLRGRAYTTTWHNELPPGATGKAQSADCYSCGNSASSLRSRRPASSP
jgi:hypothetical protein